VTAQTPAAYRNLVLYEVYVRNHGPNGTFADVEADLPRIRGLGVDIVWFMPIHPIGVAARKGTLGCPYSISDYREVNSEYGTREDLGRLIEHAHSLDMKVMIDVVYNHTAHDSRLVAEHPEFFHQDASGVPVTTVPDWTDVIDLRHGHPALTEELISTLEDWARFGVDGFRCDVASIIPTDFWRLARQRLERVKPGVIWLVESVHARWVADRRARGLSGFSDSELYDACFDLTYDYDIWTLFAAAVRGVVPVRDYLAALAFQDCIYPATFVKMRCVENHDQLRIMRLAPSRAQALAWTAFLAFHRGPFLVYAGQESAADHAPSLFELDPVSWGTYELAPFLARLAALKKDPAQVAGHLVFAADEPAIGAAWLHEGGSLYGVFNVAGAAGDVAVPFPDGEYEDALGRGAVRVRGGRLAIPADAVVLRVPGVPAVTRLEHPMLDFRPER
jgi:hypothetical protein